MVSCHTYVLKGFILVVSTVDLKEMTIMKIYMLINYCLCTLSLNCIEIIADDHTDSTNENRPGDSIRSTERIFESF